MTIRFSEESQKILKLAKREMQKLQHAFIGSEHLILSILNNKGQIFKNRYCQCDRCLYVGIYYFSNDYF